jgi:hypothetical protein
VLPIVDFRDRAYWSAADAHMREKLTFFRDMLRICLHPSLTNRAAGEILQAMQVALHAGNNLAVLQKTPLFTDAAGILSVEKLPESVLMQDVADERPIVPFDSSVEDTLDTLFINTLPPKTTSVVVSIICTSVQDYLRVAQQLTAQEPHHIGLADMAVSPLFLYELTQPDLFRKMAANEEIVRKVACQKYSAIVAELPSKRALPLSIYGEKDFLIRWFQALERLLVARGRVHLIVPNKFLFSSREQTLRKYLTDSFGSIQVFRHDSSGSKLTITLQHKGRLRIYDTSGTHTPEKLLTTAEDYWLAASEQAFFEGMPLSDVLIPEFRIITADNQLFIKFSTLPTDVGQAITDEALQYLTACYKLEECYEQERAILAETAQILIDMSDLQNCRINPELVQELRRWVQWAESKEAKQFVKKMSKPDFYLAKQFTAIARLFTEIERKFERMAEKAALDKDSMSVLRQWFERQADAISYINAFFERPDFDAPLRRINKTDVFYYIFALVQSEKYLAKHRHLLCHFAPRIYAEDDFWTWVNKGSDLWKQYSREI